MGGTHMRNLFAESVYGVKVNATILPPILSSQNVSCRWHYTGYIVYVEIMQCALLNGPPRQMPPLPEEELTLGCMRLYVLEAPDWKRNIVTNNKLTYLSQNLITLRDIWKIR